MTARGLILASMMLALAGCSSPEDQGAAPEVEATDAGAALTTDTVTEEPEVVASNEIPQGIRGRWGIGAADCDASRSDAKGAMTIEADSIRFYESVAKLAKVESVDADHVRGQFAFSGEGQTWNQGMELTLSGNGKTLVRRDSGPDAIPAPLTYQACAAQ